MIYNFCTLFDKNYLTRGLALYDSLLKFCPDFKIWMLCMDAESYEMLKSLNLEKIIPLKIEEIEDKCLLSVKNTRTSAEYCWMMSSSLPLYILEKIGVDMITYLDADLYFFQPLNSIYDEFGSNSIMIIPHWFPEKNKSQEKIGGIYNVGMLIFRNDKNGLECLKWWKEKCIEWCYAYYEDGKMGDQMYLDVWREKFKGVCILQNRGANVASWNIDNYSFFKKNDELWLKVIDGGKEFPLIFYHYHGLKIYAGVRGNICPYPITICEPKIYAKYLQALNIAYKRVGEIHYPWLYGCTKRLDIFRIIKQYTILYCRLINKKI